MSAVPLAIVVEREPRLSDGYTRLLLAADIAAELRDDRKREIRVTTQGGMSCGFFKAIVVEATGPTGFANAVLRKMDEDEFADPDARLGDDSEPGDEIPPREAEDGDKELLA